MSYPRKNADRRPVALSSVGTEPSPRLRRAPLWLERPNTYARTTNEGLIPAAICKSRQGVNRAVKCPGMVSKSHTAVQVWEVAYRYRDPVELFPFFFRILPGACRAYAPVQ